MMQMRIQRFFLSNNDPVTRQKCNDREQSVKETVACESEHCPVRQVCIIRNGVEFTCNSDS